MKDWLLYSTTNMVNWTYRGAPVSTATFKWAKQGDNAWASQAIERNGKWYWYICAEDTAVGLHGIGVAVADRPEGPYRDAIGKPLVPGNWDISIRRYLLTMTVKAICSGAITGCGMRS